MKDAELELVLYTAKEYDWAARIGAVQTHHKSQQTIITRKNQNKPNNWTASGRMDELQ